MGKFIASVKAIITRLVFGCHGLIAIWQVTNFKQNPIFWYLCCPIILLFFEGTFTLTIKANQEWKWFCPSVFLYLGSVVPAIWLLELEKVERRLHNLESSVRLNDSLDLKNVDDLKQLQRALGVNIRLPDIQISRETWVTLIEQFLMLILIIGRWMLPKGDLTRDQLSQLLLVYIGTAADIIEFFDSFKEDKVARESLLVYLTLAIWSWSLMQFTVVLTATKSRKSRLSSTACKGPSDTNCCSIDVWAIAINMILQDAPFLAFRLILIVHYEIVSYMNVFFTCKNTLLILLQLYRLYVVQSEARTRRRKQRDRQRYSLGLVSQSYGIVTRRAKRKNTDDRHRRTLDDTRRYKRRKLKDVEASFTRSDNDDDNDDDDDNEEQVVRSSKRRILREPREKAGKPKRKDIRKSTSDCSVSENEIDQQSCKSVGRKQAYRNRNNNVGYGKRQSKRKRRGNDHSDNDRCERSKKQDGENDDDDNDDDDDDEESYDESDVESEQRIKYVRRKRKSNRD